MLGFVTVVIVFSIIILVHEFGHFLVARRMGVRVERFSLGLGKVLWSKKIKDTEYAISAIPFGGYIKMAGEEPSHERHGEPWEFCAKPPGERFWIIFAGAALNLALAFLLFCFIVPTSRIGLVLEDSPAYRKGLQTNDRIVSINGREVRNWYEVLDIVSIDIEANPLKFNLERDGNFFDIIITPEILEYKNIFGKTIKKAKIGISYYGDVELLRAAPLTYLATGARQVYYNASLTYRFIWYLITGKVSIKGSVSGPVGIAAILGKAVKVGIIYLMYLVAHINLALAIFNLLPIPVLDGGYILFLGIEKIRRKPLAQKTQEVIQYVAVTLLVAFFIFVTYNDIIMIKR